MNREIEKRIEVAISEKVFPGCVVGWIKEGKRTILPFGRFMYDEGSQSVKEDSIYDVASITKVIPTSTAILTLIDWGKLSINDSVTKYIPEFGNYPDKNNVAIKHLLTYTLNLDIPSMASLKDKPASEVIHIVLSAPLREKPGLNFIYTNSTAILLGILVERITGKRLDMFAQEHFFNPLGMTRSTFHPLDGFNKEVIVPTEISEWRGGLLQGEVHDESTWILQKEGYYLGAAGLFSTAPDILKFTEMIMSRWSLDNEEIGLGWEMNDQNKMGEHALHIIGKSGFTGCMVMLSPKKQSSLVILSNRVHPKRPENGDAINAVRRDIANIIFK